MHKHRQRYRTSPPISPGLICVRKAFLVDLSAEELIRGRAYTTCTKIFSEKRSQNSHFASLNSESNGIFDKNPNNNYF